MEMLSDRNDRNENIGELVLETLLTSSIDSITHLFLHKNYSWFWHPATKEERASSFDLLAELINKQVALKDLNLCRNRVKLVMTYATDEEIGSIVLSDAETNRVICTKETTKREAGQKIVIRQ